MKNMLTKVYNWIVETQKLRAARRDIQLLTDRDLRDIGMTRTDLLYSTKRRDSSLNRCIRI